MQCVGHDDCLSPTVVLMTEIRARRKCVFGAFAVAWLDQQSRRDKAGKHAGSVNLCCADSLDFVTIESDSEVDRIWGHCLSLLLGSSLGQKQAACQGFRGGLCYAGEVIDRSHMLYSDCMLLILHVRDKTC